MPWPSCPPRPSLGPPPGVTSESDQGSPLAHFVWFSLSCLTALARPCPVVLVCHKGVYVKGNLSLDTLSLPRHVPDLLITSVVGRNGLEYMCRGVIVRTLGLITPTHAFCVGVADS
jgi:hypothetical protein